MDAARAIPEIGIDIVRVARIAGVLQRHPQRFEERVLTNSERAYVRSRPESMAGRWAAKEAVSKVLGLGVRGVGWREIEIERLPTGQPAVLLHERAAARAEQLGISGVALSISHEREFAVAVAYAVRTKGGRFVYPPGVAERLGLSPDSDGSSALDGGAAPGAIAAPSEADL
jgi:holo-[acyl-carrier protein] synthase